MSTVCKCCCEVFDGSADYCPECVLAMEDMFEMGRIAPAAPMRIRTDTGIIEVPKENIETIGHHHGLIYVETTDRGLVVGKEIT